MLYSKVASCRKEVGMMLFLYSIFALISAYACVRLFSYIREQGKKFVWFFSVAGLYLLTSLFLLLQMSGIQLGNIERYRACYSILPQLESRLETATGLIQIFLSLLWGLLTWISLPLIWFYSLPMCWLLAIFAPGPATHIQFLALPLLFFHDWLLLLLAAALFSLAIYSFFRFFSIKR